MSDWITCKDRVPQVTSHSVGDLNPIMIVNHGSENTEKFTCSGKIAAL